LLYSGPSDGYSLADYLRSKGCEDLFEVDILANPPQNVLHQNLYDGLCTAASEGGLKAVMGGPNCRTFSIRRHIPKKGGGLPVRSRDSQGTWGLPSISKEDAKKVAVDNVLLLRLMYLWSLASLRSKGTVKGFLEHPADPIWCSSIPAAKDCASIWNMKAVQTWISSLQLKTISFDQCMLGQRVPKTTTLATNLDLLHLDKRFCDSGHVHGGVKSSSELSRYPHQMMEELSRALVKEISPDAFGSEQRRPDRPLVTHHDMQDWLSPQIQVQLGPKMRPLRDGGGIPSPGRVTPPHRTWHPIHLKGKVILDMMKTHEEVQFPCESCPFSSMTLQTIRDVLVPGGLHHVEPGQPFHLELLSAILEEMGDKDLVYISHLRDGVPLGVTGPTLRSPGIWPTKEEMSGEYQEPTQLQDLEEHGNYASAIQLEDEVEKTFQEEKRLGLVEGPFTRREAATICGCREDELYSSPLGAIQEADKIRTIFDGSIGNQNSHIRANTEERTTCPTVLDCTTAIFWLHKAAKTTPTDAHGSEKGSNRCTDALGSDNTSMNEWIEPSPNSRWTLLKADVSKAHRRVKVRREDWRFQIAEIKGRYWVNKVGTYGIASAQLYWGRLAAILLRVLYALFPWIEWQFVYVDDFAWILRRGSSTVTSMAILATLTALGVPLSWKKCEMGDTLKWLGFDLDSQRPQLSIPGDKMNKMLSELELVKQGRPHSKLQIQQWLGRIQWASTGWPITRAWLQPAWAWLTSVKTVGRPSHLVRIVAHMLSDLFQQESSIQNPFTPLSSIRAASDAGADDNGRATIGGWFAPEEQGSKEQVYWFAEDVSETHSWIWGQDPPQRKIACLEMIASCTLIKLILANFKNTDLRLPIYTDNQGNAFSLLAGRAKKWPNSAIICEVLMTLYKTRSTILPMFLKREYNQWADDLTHLNFHGFDLQKRLRLDSTFPWTTLDALRQALGHQMPMALTID